MIESQRDFFIPNGHCCSDNEDITDGNNNTKRLKMTEEERLTRCRERNRLHAKSTRERKKSLMDCLETRIEELVVEKQRLSNTASESSVASILMSLSTLKKQVGITGLDLDYPDVLERSFLHPFKVESDDEIAESVEKPEYQTSSHAANKDESREDEVTNRTPEILRDKIPSTSLELEGVRREKNRMHAKQTRLRKKKITQEMEVIISNLEKEVDDLQSGLISLLPLPNANTMTALDYAKYYLSQHNQSAPKQSTMIDSSGCLRDTHILAIDSSPASIQRKRKHGVPLEIVGQKFFPSSNGELDAVASQEHELGTKLQWRQHLSRNILVKTTSICSESTGSLSEGSGSEGDLRPGSAVHSLLHMGVTSSSSNRESGSGSDESDAASSKHTTPTNQVEIQNTSRTQTHSLPMPDLRGDSLDIHIAIQKAPLQAHSYQFDRRNSIQNILAACAPPVTSSRKQPYWRLPERSLTSQYSHTLAGPISAAVASIYPTIMVENGNTGPFKGYLPMTGAFAGNVEIPYNGLRSHDFTIYDGYKNRVSKDL